jgi:CBS domain containing-hemolysin-like protein
MMHVKDILRCLAGNESLCREHLRSVPHLPVPASMDQVMSALRGARAQMAVVMDEQGGTAGILTVEDLFDEVVGDVGDEAHAHAELVRESDGSVRAAGILRLETLGDALGLALEHEDVDTVSGLVLYLLGRPPRVGDEVRHADLHMRVLAVEGHGVREVRATAAALARQTD